MTATEHRTTEPGGLPTASAAGPPPAALVRAATGSGTGIRLADVRMRGGAVTMAYVPDENERRRRAAASLSGITRLDLLDVLLGLPLGSAVPWGSLSPRERRAIAELPPGCVDLAPEGVVRALKRPLRAELAIVRAVSWRTGLDRAGRFGAYCARMVVLPDIPEEIAQARVEADYWGVGLAAGGRSPVVIVPPERFRNRAHTPAGWAFAEELHLRTLTRDRPA